jgi:pyruvate dehydrogenase E1 component beta subunit
VSQRRAERIAGSEGLAGSEKVSKPSGEVSDPPQPVPIGEAAVRRAGTDLVIITLGVSVHRSLTAAERLDADGIDAAVVEVRTVAPLDTRTITDLATTTRRVLVVDEDYRHFGLAAELAAVLAESGVGARFARLGPAQTIPYARHLEEEILPDVESITAAARRLTSS